MRLRPVPVRRRGAGAQDRALHPGGHQPRAGDQPGASRRPGGGQHSGPARVGTDRTHPHGLALACADQDGAAVARAHERRTLDGQRGDGFTAARASSGPGRADARHAHPIRGPDRHWAIGGSICRSVRGSVRRTGAVSRVIRFDAVGKAIWRTVVSASRPDANRKAIEGCVGGAGAAAGGSTGRDSGASPGSGTIRGGGIGGGAVRARTSRDGTSQPSAIRGDTCRAGAIWLRPIRADAGDQAGLGPVRGAHPFRGAIRPGTCGPALLPALPGRARAPGRRNGAHWQ